MKNFTFSTLKELTNYKKDDLNTLTKDEFNSYIERCNDFNLIYLFDGLTKDEWNIKDLWAGVYEPIKYHGTLTKRLVKDNNVWEIREASGLIPEFRERPMLLSKDDFENKMLEIGVPKNLVKEFFEHKKK